MSKIVTVAARKGGVGKTTIAYELAWLLGAPLVDLEFDDGSVGSIHYLANGSKAFPKERLEVFVAGRVLQLDNFRRLRGFGWPGFRRMNLWRQDKGQVACARAFIDAISNGTAAPIPFAELLEVSRVSIEIQRNAG